MKQEIQPIPTTSEILAFKILNRDLDRKWVIWAIDMLAEGFDSEHLRILAGKIEPFNQFEMQQLTDRVIAELKLDISDNLQVLKNYTSFLINEALAGKMKTLRVLSILKDLYQEIDHPLWEDFYLLYYAKIDLLESEDQWYWDDATRENIDQIISGVFKKYVS